MKIAIIAGSGDLPLQIAEQNPDAFVLCIKGYSTPTSFKNNSHSVSLIDPFSWISVLKKNKISHLVMAGKINRTSTDNLSINESTHKLINTISSLGDNSALGYIEKFFNENGFELLPISSIFKDCFFSKGFYREEFFSVKFKDFVIANANFGTNLLNKMSEFDVGQSVVTNNQLVYAIEALEGTDLMINRAGELYKTLFKINDFGPVLIKIPKLNQNYNLDLPVIGLKTIKKCKKLGFSSIVVSSKGTLIVDIKKVKAYLNNNNFCIYAI